MGQSVKLSSSDRLGALPSGRTRLICLINKENYKHKVYLYLQ
uniref:Uncharacterized protein n=1 Tax=Siphoviridae sp. ctRuT6 TaxID=2826339 RepID=A0A8S5N2G2_9CAUD|nr:MAG TPA: hypothetical protein [Siphoviridae sp. ctRuT6]DAL48647.1 MAG TPA_asm: hypothetical protein [Caudoviricetes sp.]